MKESVVTGKEIGGYFELEVGPERNALYPEALRFQSGRAALLALLEVCRPRRVWVPNYICSSVIDVLNQAKTECRYYRIDTNLHIAEEITLLGDDILIYVNYFGVQDAYIKDLLARYAPGQVVIDCTQSLFSHPFDCLATIYSPRKFVGVPDGGLLVSSLPIQPPAVIDEGSYERILPLIKRMAFSAEAGYEEHRKADRNLGMQRPMQMSKLTHRLLGSIDFKRVADARRKNFMLLHSALASANMLVLDAQPAVAPMCYPLLTHRHGFREFLIRKRIYVPRYWEGVGQTERFHVELFMADHIVPLPCDQRYDSDSMQQVIDAWHAFLEQ
jgi:hypothetical protein